MISISEDDIEGFDKAYRTSLINYLAGAKSANLVGTRNTEGQINLALFSSVIHLGAHPPMLGFIMRPVHVERHTYENIAAAKSFTVNAVARSFQDLAHQTSARYPKGISEFAACGFTAIYEAGFFAPHVAESPLTMACELEDDIEIPANGTRLIVGRIKHIRIAKGVLRADGSLDFDKAELAAITGLDEWHGLTDAVRYTYAKPNIPLRTLTP